MIATGLLAMGRIDEDEEDADDDGEEEEEVDKAEDAPCLPPPISLILDTCTPSSRSPSAYITLYIPPLPPSTAATVPG